MSRALLVLLFVLLTVAHPAAHTVSADGLPPFNPSPNVARVTASARGTGWEVWIETYRAFWFRDGRLQPLVMSDYERQHLIIAAEYPSR